MCIYLIPTYAYIMYIICVITIVFFLPSWHGYHDFWCFTRLSHSKVNAPSWWKFVRDNSVGDGGSRFSFFVEPVDTQEKVCLKEREKSSNI